MPEKDMPFLIGLYNERTSNIEAGREKHKRDIQRGYYAKGASFNGWASGSKDRAVLTYIVHHDIIQTKKFAFEAPDWAIEPFKLKEKGIEIDDCCVDIDCLFHIHTGLAGGNFKGVLDLARAMGNDRKLDQRESHVDNRRYGYFLKAFLTNDAEGLAEWLPVVEEKFIAKGKGFYYGNCLVLKAILEKNLEMAQQGLAAMVRFHKNSTGWNKVDCHLCLDGVGLANLCRWKGLWVEGIEPLIPNDLLMNEEEIKEAIAALPLQGG